MGDDETETKTETKTLVTTTVDNPESTTECPLCDTDSAIIDKDEMIMFGCGTFVNKITFGESGHDHVQKGAVVGGTQCVIIVENKELKMALNDCLDRLTELQFEPTLKSTAYRELAES